MKRLLLPGLLLMFINVVFTSWAYEIAVFTGEKEIKIEANAGNTVAVVKERIAEKVAMPIGEQRLFYQGTELKDDYSLTGKEKFFIVSSMPPLIQVKFVLEDIASSLTEFDDLSLPANIKQQLRELKENVDSINRQIGTLESKERSETGG